MSMNEICFEEVKLRNLETVAILNSSKPFPETHPFVYLQGMSLCYSSFFSYLVLNEHESASTALIEWTRHASVAIQEGIGSDYDFQRVFLSYLLSNSKDVTLSSVNDAYEDFKKSSDYFENLISVMLLQFSQGKDLSTIREQFLRKRLSKSEQKKSSLFLDALESTNETSASEYLNSLIEIYEKLNKSKMSPPFPISTFPMDFMILLILLNRKYELKKFENIAINDRLKIEHSDNHIGETINFCFDYGVSFLPFLEV